MEDIMTRSLLHVPLTVFFILLHSAGLAAEPLRIGTLAFGTLNWELSVIHDEGLDKKSGLTIETTNLAGADAGRIALQGGSVDLVVGDWIWVAQQRLQGIDFSFWPYSRNQGALMVPGNSPIKSISDLQGKRLGIAGGGIDKNWLMLQAMARKSGLDLDATVEKIFGAPPLLSQEFENGKLDALLTYWNYSTRLAVLGNRKLLDGIEMQKSLGINGEIPTLGYVFKENWAKANASALLEFFRITGEAKEKICSSDATWAKVAPLTRESDEKVRLALRQQYCDGRVTSFGDKEQKAAGEVFALISKPVEGKTAQLPAGVFWQSPVASKAASH